MEDRGGEAEQCAGAEACEHVAELADGRVGEHPLEVVLDGADQRGNERRGRSHDRHEREGSGAGLEERRGAGHKIDAGGHHRGGVDERTGGRGPFHRVGQPDVQRQLRALAAGSQEEQKTDGSAHRSAHVGGGVGKPRRPEDAWHQRAVGKGGVVEVERAVGHPEQERGHGQAEVADAVDEKRLLRRFCRLGLREPEADQQVATGAHCLPEDVDQQKVAGRHEHRH